MRIRFGHQAVLTILLICQLSVCLATERSNPTDPNRYLNAVREFADNVLKYGRDTYGPKHTPLFVDGLNIHTHEPVKWINPDGYKWVLSNFASQQTLLRTLDGLSTVTGDPKYRDAAMQAIRYVFENLQAPNGLLYWGHDATYDALGDKVYTDNLHVLKIHYPYYELMWEVNPGATKRFIEAFWSAHILDWSNLDMDRISILTKVLGEPWSYEYEGGPVFFKSKLPWGGAQLWTGSSLVHAAATLHKLSNEEQPYVWSKRLARRYIDTRHPKTGISAPLYNGHWLLGGDDLKERCADPYTTFFPYSPFDYSLSYPEDGGEAQPWIGMLLVGRMLGEEGREFTQWGLEELTAWGKSSYRKRDNSFVPILTDGTSIEGYVWKEYPSGLNVAKSLPADGLFFWAYTISYSATSDDFMWQMARDIASGNGFGDIGESRTDKPQLRMDTTCSNAWDLLGFLELYAGTNTLEFLQMARRIGDNIIDEKFYNGFFVPSKKHIYERLDCFEPLVLLRLYAVIKSTSECIPQAWPNNPLFCLAYRYRLHGVDRRLIYALTETAEPPFSLQEAASIGDVSTVKSLLDKGVNPNSWDNPWGDTALGRAVENGHKEVVELLIARGAHVNVAVGSPGYNNIPPLRTAVVAGHKDIVELLLAKGADINAKYSEGKTALDVAISENRKDIVELLVAKGAEVSIHAAARLGDVEKMRSLLDSGADVKARDNDGATPLHLATTKEVVELLVAKGADVNANDDGSWTPLMEAALKGYKQVAEFLITKGADINAKNNDGRTPLDIAISANHPEILKLLFDKGAQVSSIHTAVILGDLAKVKMFLEQGIDINAKDNSTRTALHYAARSSHKEIVEVLLANGADVNAGDYFNRTAAEYAMEGNHTEIVELLISKGADISPLHFALHLGDLAKVRSLIEGGADVNKRTPYGTTPLFMAVGAGLKDIVELLIAKGANVNAKDNWDWTPLHSAAADGHKDIVELLIARGANVNAKDGGGMTPLYYAKEQGHTEIVEMLRKHGAKE